MTDLVRVHFAGGPSGDWYSSMHIDRLLGGDAQASADAVHAFWDAMKAAICNDIQISIDPNVTIVNTITGEPEGIDTVTTSPISGGDTTDPLPWQTQGLIYWNTGTWVNGRQVRGRTFVPGPCESSNTSSGIPESGYKSALAAGAAVFVSASTCVPGVYSKAHQNVYPVVGATIQASWALMRTRR